MEKFNKMFSIALSIIMILSIVPITVNAEETSGKCGDNVFWSYDNETNTLTISGTGDMRNMSSSHIDPWAEYTNFLRCVYIEYGVTSIGDYSFDDCSNLDRVIISDSVTKIGKGAFEECTSLEDITIPDSVTKIDANAFAECSNLEKITIGRGSKNIHKSAIPIGVSLYYAGTLKQWYDLEISSSYLYSKHGYPVHCVDGDIFPSGNCSGESWEELIWEIDDIAGILTISGEVEMANYKEDNQPWKYYAKKIKKVVIGNGVKTIGNNSFYCCDNLTNITIPNSVQSIGENFAFFSAAIDYDGTSAEWLTLIGKGNIRKPDMYSVFCSDKTLSPSGIGEDNLMWSFDIVTYTLTISGIGEMDDYFVGFIDDTQTYVDERPWSELYYFIKTAVVADGVTSIGDRAFAKCKHLEKVTISNSVTTIGIAAFYYCENLEEITLGNNVTKICTSAFEECKNLKNVKLGNKITTIEDGTFYHCESLLRIDLPAGVTSIGSAAFGGCKSLSKIDLPAGVTSIGYGAFSSSGLEHIVIPEGVTEIAQHAFFACRKLVSVTMNNKVTKFGDGAFQYCSSLKTIFIPASVERINTNAMRDCTNLESICVAEDNPYFSSDESGVLYNKDKSILIRYPSGKKQEKYVVPDHVKIIGELAVSESNNLVTLVIGNETQGIDNMAFTKCEKLETVTIGNKVEYIGFAAFEQCKNIKTVTIGNNVKSIVARAFNECPNFETVNYIGTEEEWVDITGHNGTFYNARVHYSFKIIDNVPTCIRHGYIQYTCDCCGVYNTDYTANPTGHSINADGICENCGEQEAVNNTVPNNQLLGFENILQLIMNFIFKMLDTIMAV